jgi:MYXO-CTERM domain-containing protein
VVDTAGTVSFDTGLFAFPATTMLSYLPEPIRSTLPLRLLISDFGDLGLDNVVFGQVAPIPEPGTWALGLAGLAALSSRVRQRSRSN